ncbi:hypothetical protein B0A53_02792 [Rhodotorula sp. CCFEE 5036]|nr:hypothetical protein B0A53_02792 [Rhodotorula sp. CCFEE 5036]
MSTNPAPHNPPGGQASSFAAMKEQAAREKPTGSDEKRELAGDDSYVDSSAGAKETRANALDNPLTGISLDRLEAMGRAFAREKGLGEFELEFAKGAQAAQDATVTDLPLLDEEDREVIRREVTHKWSHPKTLYFVVVACSMAAATQGMDESVTNGANLFWAPQFGLITAKGTPGASKNQWLLGLTAGAPYLCCAVLGCWLTSPVNKVMGRRYAMALAAAISFIGCIWSACVNSWQHLLGARFFLGIGVGLGSATVPVFAAETAPPLIRGALVMQWQVWTAFGIMLGTVSGLAFYHVPDPASGNITGLNWRIMLGSAIFPSIFVMAFAPFLPESPRWLIGRGRYVDAFNSLCRLRHTRLQAARDLFFIHVLLEEEAAVATGRSPLVELFAVARNRRAALASGIVMFMQQFCGINVIAYYSSTIFREAGFSEISALGATLGFGALNWVSAAPALFTIDSYGRRVLLLWGFPLMAIFLLLTGVAFLIPKESTAHIAVVALGIYLHCIAYSPTEGPVPFTYSSEDFIVALTFPRLLDAFTPTGAFLWYSGWCWIGAVLVLFFVPETRNLTLEELDQVFSVPTMRHAKYQLSGTLYAFRKYILRQHLPPRQPLYLWEDKMAVRY